MATNPDQMHWTPLLQSHCWCLLFTSTSVAVAFCAHQFLLCTIMLSLTQAKIQEWWMTIISFQCDLWPPPTSWDFFSPASVEETYLTFFSPFPPTVKILRGRELTGAQRFSSICPVSNYERMRLHRRILGHLSAVYCIAFDRTGLRIFTVSSEPPRP